MGDYNMNDNTTLMENVQTPEYVDLSLVTDKELACKSQFGCTTILPPSLSAGTKSSQLTNQGGWTHKKFLETDCIYNSNKLINFDSGVKIRHIFHEYQLQFTLTGVSGGDDIELSGIDLPAAFELQRINLHFSDTASKSFSVTVYGHEKGSINASIMSYSSHFNQDYEDTIKRVFLMANKILINIDGTAYKKVDITISLQEYFQFQGE